MAHIVIATFGSLGDLHPYLAIALELQLRGHRATIAASETYRAKTEALGVGFRSVRPDLPDPDKETEVIARLLDTATGTEYLLREMLMPHLRNSFDDLMAATEDADCLVTHATAFAGPLVARYRGLPWISAVLSPVTFLSVYDPLPPPLPVLARLYRFGTPGVRLCMWLVKRELSRMLRPYEVFRQQLGLPEKGSLMDGDLHSPALVLALFSSALGKPQKDWPRQTVQCGFSFYDARGSLNVFAGTSSSALQSGDTDQASRLSPEIEEFLQAGDPPLVFTLGSSAVLGAGSFYRESCEIAKRLRRRAILLAGTGDNVPPTLPEGVVAFDYAPFSALFPRCEAIVHPGGVGTTGQALRSGRPQLVVPFTNDQPDNAARIDRLAIGGQISRTRFTADDIAPWLKRMLDDPAVRERARRIGEQVQSEDGTAKAADEIEKFLVNRGLVIAG